MKGCKIAADVSLQFSATLAFSFWMITEPGTATLSPLQCLVFSSLTGLLKMGMSQPTVQFTVWSFNPSNVLKFLKREPQSTARPPKKREAASLQYKPAGHFQLRGSWAANASSW